MGGKGYRKTYTRNLDYTLRQGRGVRFAFKDRHIKTQSGQKQKNITEGLNHVIHAMPDPTPDDHMLFPSIVLAVPKVGCHHTKKAKKQAY